MARTFINTSLFGTITSFEPLITNAPAQIAFPLAIAVLGTGVEETVKSSVAVLAIALTLETVAVV